MFNIDLLFDKNSATTNIKTIIKNGRVVISFKCSMIDGKKICQLIEIVNTIEKKYMYSKIPILIDLGEVVFADKLTMVIFECICFYLIESCKRLVYLQYRISQNDIWTEGIQSTPFLLLGRHDREHVNKFLMRFKFEVFSHHFRRLIVPSEDK